MNDRAIIYINIINTIRTAMCNFWNEIDRVPNKILLSKDVVDFILSYDVDLITYCAEPNVRQMMGMDIEIISDKKGFIEVCYTLNTPYTVNTDYIRG